MKITVIYQEFFQTGSHRNSIVNKLCTEVADLSFATIEKHLEEQDICMSQVNFIFDGHARDV